MIDSISSDDRAAQIPRGVADYFWAEARERRDLESNLLDLFRSWGYGDVIAPMFEYADVVRRRASRRLLEKTYTFPGRDGTTLALRPDMTIPVARLVGTRLHDWPMPQRFCYAGSVFRYTEPQAGRQREFHQAGVELIGAAGAGADAEVIALTVAALRTAGLDAFKLVVGHLGFFSGLLQALALEAADESALQQAVDRNSAAELADLVHRAPLSAAQRRTLEELPQLSGADAGAVMARAEALCLNRPMRTALANLRAILDALDSHGVMDAVILDLTEINDLGYYTGLTFEALAPGLGFTLAGGGRYNDLIETFGHPHPAVGVALGLDRLLLAQHAQQGGQPAIGPVPAQSIVMCANQRQCMELVETWRAQGESIVVDVSGDEPAVVWQRACTTGIPQLLVWQDRHFDVYDNPDSNKPSRRVEIGAANDARPDHPLRNESVG